jgi:hypothetical protein
VKEVIKGYLVDVVDQNSWPMLLLKSGESRAVAVGSWFINCTGYLEQEETPYEPYVSASGKVVSINLRSSIQLQTASAAYLAVHLSCQNKLQTLPLYELDRVALQRASHAAFVAASNSHTIYNMMLMAGALPAWVMKEFGVNLHLWYPLPRRILDLVRLGKFQERNPNHIRRTLDVVHERFNLRCGPLIGSTAAT